MSNSENNGQKDKGKKEKNSYVFANITVDWVSQILLIAVVIAATVFAACFGGLDGWVFWVILAALAGLIIFFIVRMIYKIYSGRLSVIRVDKTGISYTKHCKRVFVSAENLVTGLVDYGKAESGKFYIGIADKNDEVKDDKDRVVFLLNPKRMEKLTDARISPPQMISFLIGLCDSKQLKESLDTANENLLPFVRAELDKREAQAAEIKKRAADKQRAEEAERNRRKNKKKKKH